MAKNRISELDLATINKLGVFADSYEAQTIDPRYLVIVDGTPSSKYSLSSGTEGFVPDIQDEVYEKPGVPHMDDIKIISNSTYVDKKNNVRTKVVLRIKNSSGQPVLGVDARLEVKTGDDQ